MNKVVIIGPESTGKSTLANQLADHYRTVSCPEFAREYLSDLKRNYTFEDLLNIAKGQLQLEHYMLTKARNNFYFIDTDMYVMKVWCEVAFNNCHTYILKQIALQQYDLHLICDVDLPWVEDELREYPDLTIRRKLFKMYKDLMVNSTGPWAVISGNSSQRLQTATSIIDTMFKNSTSRNGIKIA